MAFRNFEECRIRSRYFGDRARIVKIVCFAGCQFMKSAGRLVGTQGSSILVNKMLGPACNATVSIGNAVAGHTATFSGSITSSFYPAIVNAAGEGDLGKMRRFAYRTCSFAAAVILLFAIPLVLEMNEILRLWLKTPPNGATVVCTCTILGCVVMQMTEGCWMAVYAIGKIGQFQLCGSFADISAFLFVLLLLWLGMGVAGVGVAVLCASIIATGVHLWFARSVAEMSISHWMKRVLVPIVLCGGVSFFAGGAVVYCLEASVLRICLTVSVVEAVCLPLVWFLVLDGDDRKLVREKVFRSLLRRSANG